MRNSEEIYVVMNLWNEGLELKMKRELYEIWNHIWKESVVRELTGDNSNPRTHGIINTEADTASQHVINNGWNESAVYEDCQSIVNGKYVCKTISRETKGRKVVTYLNIKPSVAIQDRSS